MRRTVPGDNLAERSSENPSQLRAPIRFKAQNRAWRRHRTEGMLQIGFMRGQSIALAVSKMSHWSWRATGLQITRTGAASRSQCQNFFCGGMNFVIGVATQINHAEVGDFAYSCQCQAALHGEPRGLQLELTSARLHCHETDTILSGSPGARGGGKCFDHCGRPFDRRHGDGALKRGNDRRMTWRHFHGALS